MPPKGHRPARGPNSGRGGRGRGRGKAVAAHAPSASAPEPKESDPESQSTIEDAPMVDAGPVANTTPVYEQDDEPNDPNSSPATQPTETPAPTPVRLPPTSNANAVASGSGARGTGTAKPSKFKPKFARTNAKEREEREAREREKENARLGAAANAARRAARGRGRGGRGRGDAMGRGRMQTSGTASGPFAEVPTSGVKKGFFSGATKKEFGPSLSRGTGGASGSAVKTRGEGFASGGSRAAYDSGSGLFQFDPQYPGEDDDAPRVDIEHINVQSDSEDDVIITGVRSLNKGKGKQSNKGGLKPIRLDRKEHKHRGTIVNTEPVIKADPDEKDDADVMVIDEGRSSKAPRRERRDTFEGDVQIKSEPGIIPQMTYIREPTASSPPLPEFKVPVEFGDDESNIEPEPAKSEPVSPSTERKSKPRRPKQKDKMPVIQTEEDRAEWARHLEDVDILRRELSGMAANLQPQDKGKDVEGDVDMEGAAAQESANQVLEDGRVYLFQFPPVLPKLYNEQTSSNPNIDDVELMVPFDLTKDDKEIKTEEVIEIKKEELDEDELSRRKERERLVVEEGQIGKLVLRESGEVELVWGGTNMKLGRGIETSFFGLGAVVDGMDAWQKDEDGKDALVMNGSQGKSMAMGEIMGKFVATPDWTNIR